MIEKFSNLRQVISKADKIKNKNTRDKINYLLMMLEAYVNDDFFGNDIN